MRDDIHNGLEYAKEFRAIRACGSWKRRVRVLFERLTEYHVVAKDLGVLLDFKTRETRHSN